MNFWLSYKSKINENSDNNERNNESQAKIRETESTKFSSLGNRQTNESSRIITRIGISV